MYNLEATILLWIQQYLRCQWLTPIMKGLSLIGDLGAVWIVIIVVLFLNKHTRKISLIALMSLLMNLIVCNGLIKPMIGRVRPYERIEGLNILVKEPWDHSFPSGHTSAAFAAAWILYLRFGKKVGIPALILATLISFSRLYVGVHYPSDVLGGIFVGTLIAFVVNHCAKRLEERGKI